jgi:RND family efflux transporter MFP subunit
VPESEIDRIKEGSVCSLKFTSFPNDNFSGTIDHIADMVDQSTRMVKLRITLSNGSGKLKAGMFATVSFVLSEGDKLSVNKNAVVTIQANSYVFEKTGAATFERRRIVTGDQVGDRIIVYSGLKGGEAVAVKGVMQLKGLSFGY